jgi:hypothetical protein
VIVSVNVPLEAFLAGEIVRVEDPDPVTEAGLNVAVVRLGTPLTVRFTVAAKPF